MRPLLPLLLCAIASAQDRIGAIDFFGTAGIDLARVRAALPVKEGDQLPESRTKIKQAVRRVLGKDPTDITFVCCDNHGSSVIYIGLPGNTRATAYNRKPTGPDRLPKAATQLYDQTMAALMQAVQAGDNGEDRSPGYAQSKNAALQANELEIRQYALANQSLLLQVLKSSSESTHRETAAHFLGYAEQSPQQIQALVNAANDPNQQVRNNSTRALAVLAESSPQLAEQIDPTPFIAMLSSGTWTDRNKASAILLNLTRTRSPKLLAALREQALVPLTEMGRWSWPGGGHGHHGPDSAKPHSRHRRSPPARTPRQRPARGNLPCGPRGQTIEAW